MMTRGLVLAALGALALLAGCSVDADANPSRGCGDCPAEFCYHGYCLLSEGGGATDAAPRDAGDDNDGGDHVDAGPEPCTEKGKSVFCYDGPGTTSTMGLCRAGMHTCERAMPDADLFFGPCLGQVLPSSESCNADDDDCDGKIDEAGTVSCETGQDGICARGTSVCQAGTEVCERTTDPSAESCNGEDDDCDGKTDEGTSVACYPGATEGCSGSAMDGFECDGTCTPGMRKCIAGTLEACSGHTPPASEDCATSGTAADEDCDGKTDEACPCTGSEQQDCSSGGNSGVGQCAPGTQTCDGSTFGPCEGEVLPTDETCANEGGHDDDCNEVDDDIPTRGDACVDGDAMGVCRDGTLDCADGKLVCGTPAAVDAEACDMHDDDCDGKTDESFLLASDEANCGECGNECGTGMTCCGGRCVNTKTDEDNCMTCGNSCGTGLTCCNSNCVDTDTNASHCGMCGNQCGGLPPCCRSASCGGVLCL